MGRFVIIAIAPVAVWLGAVNATAQPLQSAAPAAATVAAKAPSWRLAPSLLADMRVGGQLATQPGHPSGGAIELTFGYQFANGLTPVVDFATSVMFNIDVGPDATPWYLRAGGGLRYTVPLARVRPWVQGTYGLIAYSVTVNAGDRDIPIAATAGHGLSLTAGFDVGLARAGSIGLWLGLCGGVDVGLFGEATDTPMRAMLTLGLHR